MAEEGAEPDFAADGDAGAAGGGDATIEDNTAAMLASAGGDGGDAGGNCEGLDFDPSPPPGQEGAAPPPAEGADEAAIEGNTAAMLAQFGGGGDGGGEGDAQAQIGDSTAAMLAQFGGDTGDGGDAEPHELTEAEKEAKEELRIADETADQVKDWMKKEEEKKTGPLEGRPDDRLIKVKGLDKQQLCIDLLMVGCVQSFVDFFYITHRKSTPGEGSADIMDPKDVDIPEETLIFFKETLESAELARRSQSYQSCFENYNTLAEYFERVSDLKSAMYFFQRCADVASEVQAHESIAKANLNLGACEERGNNWQSAMQFHEKALQIATSADSLPLQIKAASRLTKVYQVLAELCEKDNRDSDATALYERCLSCAQLSKDDTLEGTACHKLGLSKYRTGQYERAIELQKQYLEICRVHDDRVGESAARAALAHAYEAVGGTQEAIKQLENLLNVASEAGELKAQASACLNLGILYNGRGDHEKSVELLEQHFDLARQIGDRRLIDSARVVLGMVRGNGKLRSYIDLVNNDLDKLLKWKSKRATLDT